MRRVVASVSARYSGSSAGRCSRIASRCMSMVAQSPRSIGPVSSKSLSIVRRISGSERLRRRAGRLEERRRGAVDRDEEARRERRARVVERLRLVGEVERLQPEGLGELAGDRARLVGLGRRPRAQAPSSCSGPRRRVNVCSGWRLKRRSCGASAASRVAPLTCATQGPARSPRATSAIAGRGRRAARRRRRRPAARPPAPRAGRPPPSRHGRRRSRSRCRSLRAPVP